MLLEDLTKLHHRHPNSKAIYGGDFNMITSLEENKGGLRSLNSDSKAFNSFIISANLVDIPPRNGIFTWTNKRGGDRHIASWLDRFLVYDSILMEGVTIYSDILPSGGSDHWPITLNASILGTPEKKTFPI